MRVRVYPFFRLFLSGMVRLVVDSSATEHISGVVGDV